MNEQDLVSQLKSKFSQFKKDSIQSRVFDLLSDQQWHCRSCEGKSIASEQYAGKGGIQGLEAGNKSGRPGLKIETKKEFCPVCNKKTTSDRWTGEIQKANVPANISKKLHDRILEFYSYTDVIEERQRPKHELIIDHRFPMGRWGGCEIPHNVSMSEDEIKNKFQLLKKDPSGNHNLLKSRSCENCIKTGTRGTPFGIRFWYQGGENWTHPYQRGAEAEEGCIGCGWYDFEKWRDSLNQTLTTLNQAD